MTCPSSKECSPGKDIMLYNRWYFYLPKVNIPIEEICVFNLNVDPNLVGDFYLWFHYEGGPVNSHKKIELYKNGIYEDTLSNDSFVLPIEKSSLV